MNIPYGKQNIEQFEIDELINTLNSNFLTQGPKIIEFEKKFAKYVNAKYAVAVSSATAGLHLSIKSLGVKRGNRIITTPISFAATANCARYEGAEVWLADIDPKTYLISFEKTKELIESKPKGFFSGIIPVDFGGLPVNLKLFKQLAEEHSLWIIEDACHAPGGYYTDTNDIKRLCGEAIYSECSVFSFHPVKHIACGEGGMVTTNSKKTYEKIKKLRTHGISKKNMSENPGGWYYEMQELGFNYRLTDIQATLGITQLAKNNSGVLKRNEIAQKYQTAFKSKIKFQRVPDNFYNAYHLFIIEYKNRKKLYDYLKALGIHTQVHYIPIHKLPYYKKIGYSEADLKNSEEYYENCLSLPMYPTLTSNEQDFIINKVLDFIN